MQYVRTENVHGTDILIRDGTPDIQVAQSNLGGEFDHVCKLLAETKKPNTILDLGGYIGTAAIKFATAIPNATVISVEPNRANFEMLFLNTSRYRNVIPVNAAVGGARSRQALFSRKTGAWGYTLVSAPKDQASPVAVEDVDVRTIHEILRKYSPAGNIVSLVKIDIEGSERELLREHSWIDSVAVVTAELHDRIVDGCSSAWDAGVDKPGRSNADNGGEKRISFSEELIGILAR